jgi:predicted histidine transporter YuiF (NhaC family)
MYCQIVCIIGYPKELIATKGEIDMIFGLHPALGFLPLIIYIVLSFMGYDVTLVLLTSVVLGAILTGTGLAAFGQSIAAGLGSFLGMIGFIILLGAGVGEVLTQSKVAQYIVWLVMKKLGVNSLKRAMIAVMASSFIIVALLGSQAGGNAILAPIVIPIVAALGMTPSTLAILLHGAGATGLFLGPFVPPVVTTLALTKISYFEYLLYTGIPVSVLIWIVTYFIAMRIQKQTEGKYAYTKEDIGVNENNITNSDEIPAFVNDTTKRAFSFFCISMLVLVFYGIATKAGAAYVITVMTVLSFITGKVAGLTLEESLKALVRGGTRMYWIFFMFILYEPFLTFITQSGAFTWMTEFLAPYLQGAGRGMFLFIATTVGIVGIPGAAVAHEKIIHELFGSMAAGVGIPAYIWAVALLVGSQLNFFMFPTGDIIGQMGLARSKDLISMMKHGIMVSIVIMFYLVLIAILVHYGVF